mmetsp:Transcript_49067/g.96206  ORF Transcript_49067/g.96206 Transcript_49067/m.96206 type:complete len:82 (+) Transcript_49067:179-424(+)
MASIVFEYKPLKQNFCYINLSFVSISVFFLQKLPLCAGGPHADESLVQYCRVLAYNVNTSKILNLTQFLFACDTVVHTCKK